MAKSDVKEVPAAGELRTPSLAELFGALFWIGMTGFGGGLAGWVHRKFVGQKHWMSNDEFLAGLSLAQVMPGANILNLAIWIGFRLYGSVGAVVAVLGVIAAPMIIVILVTIAYGEYGGITTIHFFLAGVAAAAVGSNLYLGIRSAQRAATDWVTISILLASFVGVGVLRLPMLLVLAVIGPISLTIAFRRGVKNA